MTKHQMARKIKDLEQRIKDLETQLQSVTGRILPVDLGRRHGLTRITGCPVPSWTQAPGTDSPLDTGGLPDEIQDTIATLQRDMREMINEVGDLGSRVWQLEQHKAAARPNGGRRPSRFQDGYDRAGHGA